MSAPLPPFADWYEAVHLRAPFPWQDDLATRLLDGRGWPSEVGVPTGLGKTACLDIAIWWLASQADLPAAERTAPTRIWWLVNRRLLVDATADHARSLQARLREATRSGPIGQVAARLGALSPDPGTDPLEVVRLRGGAARGRPTDPSQPAVILSTIPMYGSRLLFRGYGSSRSMRPIDAALAGTDALVLVDEAHLAHHLMALFAPLEACDRAEQPLLPVARQRPVVVSLTATGGELPDRLDLSDRDRSHPEVAKRLGAAKPLRLVEGAKSARVGKVVAEETADLLATFPAPVACVVFLNSPKAARDTATALERLLPEDAANVLVATGRQRDREAQVVRDEILDPERGAKAGRAPSPRSHHLVVVATQTLEVGADLDFDALVTESCGTRALTQRLGRLNRLGGHAHAAARYVHLPPPPRASDDGGWPVYGTEPAHVWERLEAAAVDGVVDVGPERIADVLGPPQDDPGRSPELLPALLWEWVKTTSPPDGEAPVEPYFSGLSHPTTMVTLCWRAHLPEVGPPGQAGSNGTPASPDDSAGARPLLWPRVRPDETIDIPLTEAREVLAADDDADGPRTVIRLAADRTTVERVVISGLRPGDTVILRSTDGLYDARGWAPDSAGPVLDVALPEAGLPLDPRLWPTGEGSVNVEQAIRALLLVDGDDRDDLTTRVDALKELISGAPPPPIAVPDWPAFVTSLDDEIVASSSGPPRLLIRSDEEATGARSDEFDELSAGARAAIDLDHHGAGVGARAHAVATALGVQENLIEIIQLAAALHDTGKADPRFQRWLDPLGEADGLLAKSTSPIREWAAARTASGWPRGGRHEALSARLVQAWLTGLNGASPPVVDTDLLIHLVVSHHGRARPFLVPVADDVVSSVTATIEGAEVSTEATLSIPDWDQPRRFRQLNHRYGAWGLALMEAILRQSDHAVSAGDWAGADESAPTEQQMEVV